MHYLAIDLGDRRTGLATGDDDTGLVTPLVVLEVPAGAPLLDAIRRAVDEHGPDAIVLGLPLNMDGTEGERAAVTRAFGETLASAIGLPVHCHDERLTTDAADSLMARSGRTRGQKKRLRDALAAAEILRDFLATR